MKNNFERSCDLSQAPGLLQEAAGIVNVALVNSLEPGSFSYEVVSRFQEKFIKWLGAVDLLGHSDEVRQEITLEPDCLNYGTKPAELTITFGRVVAGKDAAMDGRLKPAYVWHKRARTPEGALDLAVDLITACTVARWLDAHVTTAADLGRVRVVGGWLALAGKVEPEMIRESEE